MFRDFKNFLIVSFDNFHAFAHTNLFNNVKEYSILEFMQFATLVKLAIHCVGVSNHVRF